MDAGNTASASQTSVPLQDESAVVAKGIVLDIDMALLECQAALAAGGRLLQKSFHMRRVPMKCKSIATKEKWVRVST
jgi:hypothetical protein